MLTDKKVIECELEYAKCFSDFYEEEDIIRFRDDQIIDMYYHNYTFIKGANSDIDLNRTINQEISLSLSQKRNYCNILFNFDIDSPLILTLPYKPVLSRMGFYSFDISHFSKLKSIPECVIKQVSTQEMIDDLLFSDLQHDEEKLGRDFCTRRCYRRGKVYVSNKGVNSYICYHNGQIIGNCDLFIHDGVAKIEDFSVIPNYQHKGYGTTILKFLIDIAINQNCHTIYLVTDEEDTAKEMYKKLNFTKIGERTDLFFKL